MRHAFSFEIDICKSIIPMRQPEDISATSSNFPFQLIGVIYYHTHHPPTRRNCNSSLHVLIGFKFFSCVAFLTSIYTENITHVLNDGAQSAQFAVLFMAMHFSTQILPQNLISSASTPLLFKAFACAENGSMPVLVTKEIQLRIYPLCRITCSDSLSGLFEPFLIVHYRLN